MKYWPYLVLSAVLPTLFVLYIVALGYTPWVSAVLTLPAETEILLFSVQAGLMAVTVGHFLGYRYAKKSKKQAASEVGQPKLKINLKYVILIVAVLAIFILPFVINSNAKFSGTDGQGPELIEGKGYTPWINPMGYEPDELGERLLFSLQVAIGGLIIGYFVGHTRGKVTREVA